MQFYKYFVQWWFSRLLPVLNSLATSLLILGFLCGLLTFGVRERDGAVGAACAPAPVPGRAGPWQLLPCTVNTPPLKRDVSRMFRGRSGRCIR